MSSIEPEYEDLQQITHLRRIAEKRARSIENLLTINEDQRTELLKLQSENEQLKAQDATLTPAIDELLRLVGIGVGIWEIRPETLPSLNREIVKYYRKSFPKVEEDIAVGE